MQYVSWDHVVCPVGNMVKVLRGHQNWVYCSAFSPDSSILCSVGAGKAVRIQDPFFFVEMIHRLCLIRWDRDHDSSITLRNVKHFPSARPFHFHLRSNRAWCHDALFHQHPHSVWFSLQWTNQALVFWSVHAEQTTGFTFFVKLK